MHITKIETVHIQDAEYERHRNLWVQVHTDDGLVGLGETQTLPSAVAEVIHELYAPMLLGRDPADIECIWADLYSAIHFYGGSGAELRGLSAVDIALWDLLSQSCGQPLYNLLGGRCRDRIRVYNTCISGGNIRDTEAWQNDAGGLAQELLDEGWTAMKIWPWDLVAPRVSERARSAEESATAYIRNAGAPGALGLVGQYLSAADLARGLEPVRKIRQAVGDRMDIAIEGHSRWSLPAALQIARALEPYDVMWLEDVIPVDNVDDLGRLRAETRVRMCVSERLFTRWGLRQVMEKGAAHIIMLDVGWCGGLTEAKKIAAAAETYHLPIAPHGAVGPVLNTASAHLCAAVPNAMVLEVVRAHYLGWYEEVVNGDIIIKEGHMHLLNRPGLGISLRPQVFARPDPRVRVSGLN